MKTLTQQIYDNMTDSGKNGVENDDCIVITQKDKSTIWANVYRFGGKYVERLTACLTPAGRIKKNSVRYS